MNTTARNTWDDNQDDVPTVHADEEHSDSERDDSDNESEISEVDSNESSDSDDDSDGEFDLKDLSAEDYYSLPKTERDQVDDMVNNMDSDQNDAMERHFAINPENKIHETFYIDEIPPVILQGIAAKGWDKPIGGQVYIGMLIRNARMNAILNASTGSGKTGIFAITGASLVNARAKCPQVLIVIPNRTLAKQIYDEICSLVAFTGNTHTIEGKRVHFPKINVALHRGIGGNVGNGKIVNATPYMSNGTAPAGTEQIVIATPGKAKALHDPTRDVWIGTKYIDPKSLAENRSYYASRMNERGTAVRVSLLTEKDGEKYSTIVQCFVDECDQILKQGNRRSESSMAADFLAIMARLHASCRYLLLSATATSSPEVKSFMTRFSNKPYHLMNTREREHHDMGFHGNVPFFAEFTVKRSLKASILHRYVRPELESDKFRWILHLLKTLRYHTMFVFCNTNECVRRVYDHILRNEPEFPIGFIDDTVDQDNKDKALVDLHNGAYRVIVSTDICAYGIDIETTDMVINFDIPDVRSINTYAHRAGRCGRNGKEGMCVSIVKPTTDAGIPPEAEMITKAFNIQILPL